MSSESATSVLAEMAVGLRLSELPDHAISIAKQSILDALGSCLAGAEDPCTSIVRHWVVAQSDRGPARIFGTDRSASEYYAAFVNAVAVHALDLDDVAPATGSHGSAPVLPALLAVGETERANGADLLASFVAGVEVSARVGLALLPSHLDRGFHITATTGAFGAAAAVCRLLGVSSGTCSAALGIATSQASGLLSAFGTMLKTINVGQASASGVLAARLAGNGLTAPTASIERAHGFGPSHADDVDLARLSAPFGKPWHIHDTQFKVHASPFLTHATIDALLGLRPQLESDRVSIADIEVRVPPMHLTICDCADPASAAQAKTSLQFLSALALVRGRVDQCQFGESGLRDPALSELRTRVRLVGDPSLPTYASHVVVRSQSGDQYSAEADKGRRTWVDDPDELLPALQAKFRSLAGPVLGPIATGEVERMVLKLESVNDIRELTALLVANRAAGASG